MNYSKEPKKKFITKKKNIALDSHLYRIKLGAIDFENLLKNIKNYDFGNDDYFIMYEIKYGPNIHVVVKVGYDIFTTDENGITSNNPETDTKHFYVQASALGDNNGALEEERLIDVVWFGEDISDEPDDDETHKVLDRMYNSARGFIFDQLELLDSLWVVQLETDSDNSGDEHYVLFHKFEDAKAFFDEQVAREKNPDISWVGDMWKDWKNGELSENDYKVEDTEDTFYVRAQYGGNFVNWTLRQKEIF